MHEEFSKLCGFQPEMCSANGAKTKEVVRVKDFIMKYLVTEGQDIVIIHAADFLVILLSELFILLMIISFLTQYVIFLLAIFFLCHNIMSIYFL